MILDKNTKILIVGLGVIGGSYAKALTDKDKPVN
jgi:prephenate dehydrogenase